MKRLSFVTFVFALIGMAATFATMNYAAGQTVNKASTVSTITPTGLIQKLNALALPDLQNADAIAKASGDTVADQCYSAIIDVINKINAGTNSPDAVQNTNKLAPLTEFQKGRAIVTSLRTTSPLFVACAPLKAQIQNDIKMLPAQGMGALMGLLG